MTQCTTNQARRILVANRGEIACRIIRSAKALGFETIAVYSDADRQAMHTRMADQAVYLGKAAPGESYLDIPAIIAAARQQGADMIHPGYGFLSENADFAEACSQNQIGFIGPAPGVIRAMACKSRAKQIMAEAGVPLVPGYHGRDQADARLIAEAEKIGYPLLIKASLGGGGKGMRVVHEAAGLLEALAAARRESVKAFGDDGLLLEAYLEAPRHVEVQIFFDRQGQGVYLFDRDCSLQRRHQKVIEEAPAPGLSDDLRQAMGKAALAAGSAIGYEGAGTVEFLVQGARFYFMEINTRLQVEHPVTERITGIDLVQWQIRIAGGEPLPLEQSQLRCCGHAIEARLYAEDPANQFLPSTGRIVCLEWPEDKGVIRIDTGVESSSLVSRWYDPLLAKVVSWGRTREKALEALEQALASCYQAGVMDNRDYLIGLLHQQAFRQGTMTTALGEEPGIGLPSPLQRRQLLAVAALYCYQVNRGPRPAPGEAGASLFFFHDQGQALRVQVEPQGKNYLLSFADGHCQARIHWQSKPVGLSGALVMAGQVMDCRVIPMPGQQLKVFLPDCSRVLGLPGYQSQSPPAGEDSLCAPMNGTVASIAVHPGQQVSAGCLLMTLEAMKMEHGIKAPRAGVIGEVFFNPGDPVMSGTPLMAYQEPGHGAV